jgi:Family of unknown function (DUF6788)
MVAHKSGLLRLPTEELISRRSELAACFGDVEHVLLGSLVEQTRRCGKAGCQCATGTGHGPYPYLAPRRGQRGMRYVPPPLLPRVRAALRQGELAEAVLAEISAINVELLARRELS